MARELSTKEIYEQMQELRNMRKLHHAAREQVELLKGRDKLQKEEIRLLRESNRKQEEIIGLLKLQVKELSSIIFGRRKKKPEENDNTDNESDDTTPRKQADRTPDSYHRTLPKDENVTKEEQYSIDVCRDCKTPLENAETRTFYE